MKRHNARVHLVHRIDERGRGSAGVAGFRYAYERGAERIIEMDADFSHDPRHIPEMLEAAADADLVIGSRLLPGGGERGRSPLRVWITRLGNSYAQLVLGIPVRDCTSGFRVFQRRFFERTGFDCFRSNGPAIVQELLMAGKAAGMRMVEVPILFEERRAGESTFNIKILLRGMLSVWAFRFRRWRFD
jgi:dolichol-phosphate mannosyltransferase